MPENPWSFGGAWGYPIIRKTGTADAVDILFVTVWTFDSAHWGLPYIRRTGLADKATAPSVWVLDSAHWGYPYIRRSGLADKATCPSIWIYVDGVHFDYPFIRKTGLADPYEQAEGIYKLYRGEILPKKWYFGENEVKKIYRGEVVVFEK